VRVVQLSGGIHLIASDAAETRLQRKAQDHPTLPATIDQVVAELNNRPDGVPAVFDRPGKPGGDFSLLIHGATWVMRLFPTAVFKGAQRGYTIAAVDPLRIRDHHRLAQGCLLVRVPSWHRTFDVRQLPDWADSQWNRLVQEYEHLVREHAAARHSAPELTPAHAAFLATIGKLVDANERITRPPRGPSRPSPTELSTQWASDGAARTRCTNS